MVRALLAGTKRQTRRVAKGVNFVSSGGAPLNFTDDDIKAVSCPYGPPGDRLWVREAWRACRDLDATPPRDIDPGSSIEYESTKRSYAEIGLTGKLRPGMFMPRWASRITLEVTGVRVERLQDISEADAMAEGVEDVTDQVAPRDPELRFWRRYRDGGLNGYTGNAIASYASLWTEINGQGSWEANPWVWVVEWPALLNTGNERAEGSAP
jgi:hypothetical protein